MVMVDAAISRCDGGVRWWRTRRRSLRFQLDAPDLRAMEPPSSTWRNPPAQPLPTSRGRR